MGRGKLLKTKVKAEKALIKARLQATKEWEERTSNLRYGVKKELITLMHKIDPLEMVAVGGLTIILQPIIATSTEILDKIVTATEHGISAIEGFLMIWEWMGLIPPRDKPIDQIIDKPISWILAFVVAFIIVRHPEVMTTMFSGATKLTGFALGLLS